MIVYSFFIGGICSGVFIMINVLTAFFVEGKRPQRCMPMT
jgi:hypothetical protein